MPDGGGSPVSNELAGWGSVAGDAQTGVKYNTESSADQDRSGKGKPVTASSDTASNATTNIRSGSDDNQADVDSDTSGGVIASDRGAAIESSRVAAVNNDVNSTAGTASASDAPGVRSSETAQASESRVVGASASASVDSAGGDRADQADTAAANKNTSGGVTASGYVPIGWEVPSTVPDKKERDKLTDIKGVGPKLEGVLHANGIYYFRQIALLDAAGLDELQEQMPEFRGRIQRDNWLGQAVDLHREKYGEAP